jgi:hypothetical protein
MRKPHQSDLERVVSHFLYYLSNTPDPETGISPRMRLYGSLPVESKLLFPDVPDDVFTSAVRHMFDVTRSQSSPLPERESWRSYS